MQDQKILRERAQGILLDQFGLKRFRRGQKSVIYRILEGKNTAAVFPTGGGKSLCYQLPSLLLPGTTVVVSPLIALMKDQCDSLARKGIAASRLDSSQTAEEIRSTFRKLLAGETKLLYLAPEKFFNERFLASIKQINISLFAIDEAHCISQWGHHFRPDYLKLAQLTKDLEVKQVLALTATATPTVLDDIRKAFKIRKTDAIRTTFHRPNLSLRAISINREEQYTHLLHRITNQDPGATLVYVTLQRTAEEIASQLQQDGIDAVAYHAGMDTEERSKIQREFLSSSTKVVVATIAFGMGIDKPDIRYVYHFNAPKSLESYAQEIGRAGRDGRSSTCEIFLAPEDKTVLNNFNYGDTPTRESLNHLIEVVHGQADSFHLSHHRLATETNIRLTVLRTVMTYLELEGWILATSPRYETYKLKPLVSSTVILEHFKNKKKQQIADLLSCLTKGRIWFSLNLTIAKQRLNMAREEIVELLNQLSEHDWVETKVSDLTFGYHWKKRFRSLPKIANQIYQQLLERESMEIERTDQIFKLCETTECYAALLSEHFGESLKEPCGNCSTCLGQLPMVAINRKPRLIGSAAERQLEDVVEEYPNEMRFHRDRAKFLCGLSSPQMIRKRLTRHPAFGICNEIAFPDVLHQLEEQSID